ncbi:glutamate--tRNA ligase [Geovibrio thiophilus]|nr:glutamate--tRNA ligase [Geovibrio thiophilus]
MSVRVRFAPSPTGHIHVGNARTALFNYLYARNTGGTFILRIEDTDFDRSTLASEELIYEDMKWLLMDWDEGPMKGGAFGPYRQSERFDIYKKYTEELLEKGHAYKCWCTKEELDAEREKARIENRQPVYGGKCRHLSPAQKAELEASGAPFAIRFKIDKDVVHISDSIKGEIDFETGVFGDFIIVRPDGVPVYNYVVVIDDALMNISHVIRGDDHLSNTPKQALIFDALNFSRPEFIHIPMILGEDRSKLSKRHGNTSIEQFRSQGYLNDALFNFLALLSWSDDQEREIIGKEDLIKSFSLDRISTSAAVFDFGKLKWLNGQYIRMKTPEELADLCLPFLMSAGLPADRLDREVYVKMIASIASKMELLGDAPEVMKVYFQYQTPDEDAAEFLKLETTPAVLKSFREKIAAFSGYIKEDEYKDIPKSVQTETGVKGKPLFMAIRVGISGSVKGPEIDKMATLMPVDELLRRLDAALEIIG